MVVTCGCVAGAVCVCVVSDGDEYLVVGHTGLGQVTCVWVTGDGEVCVSHGWCVWVVCCVCGVCVGCVLCVCVL